MLGVFDFRPSEDNEYATLKQILDIFDKYFLDYHNEILPFKKLFEIKQTQRQHLFIISLELD